MRLTVQKLRTALCFALMLLPIGLMAHPHMAMTSRCQFVWAGSRLTGAYLEWAFDAYFSADIIRGYDTNRDGAFNAVETRNVYDNAFINLKKYHFLTFIRQGDVRSNPAEVRKFSVYVKDGILHYRFWVDLSKYAGDLHLAVYDHTFFIAISYPDKNPVTFDCDPALVTPRFQIAENRTYPVYYDPLGAAGDTTVYYTWRKGLEVFYPREIHVSYEPSKR